MRFSTLLRMSLSLSHLDEAYLDVSDAECFQGERNSDCKRNPQAYLGRAALDRLCRGCAEQISWLKSQAIGTKPNGFFVILPEEIEDFIKELPIEKIWGIGQVTAQRLHMLDIRTCGELQQLDIVQLEKHFGSRAWSLYELCRGIDSRPVTVERIRKSLSVESTFLHDLDTLDACLEQVPELYREADGPLRKNQQPI